ncbi:ATP-binding protein [Butyrivibrio sp. WCD3002]|uniref:ATP-binding protein n=1 Tax=Butyrivibrio sp. WCD3002 TaxID=1280676 RepID=UPI0003F69A50|nr:ATP-binding protein [Butyrivibrio sp. WCD3002]
MALTNTQYDEIMHDYEIRRTFHRNELNTKIKEIEDHVPGYLVLSQSTGSISADFGRRLLLGENLRRGKLHEMLADVATKKKQLLTEAGYPADYLDMKYDCPICRDTGYVNGEKCSCFRQRIIERLYAQSNIRKMTESANFGVLSEEYYQGEDLERFRGAVRTSKDFIKNFETSYPNLFFYGTVGTGKSFLSVCVAKEILDKGHSVLYFSAVSLFALLQTYSFDFKKNDELYTLYDDLYNTDLLIIDDLGTEHITNNSIPQLFSCINERLMRNRSTIITTNLSLEDVKSMYSERVSSRIASSYRLCKLTGSDIRILKKMQFKNGK